MTKKCPRAWLERRLAQLEGKSKSGLALHLKVAPPRISDLLAGEREIQFNEVLAIADYLEWSIDQLLAAEAGHAVPPVSLKDVQIVGEIQAGRYRAALEWPNNEWYSITVSVNQPYRALKLRGLRVIGASMDEVFPEGSHVIFVDLFELGRNPREGEYVIVLRRGPDDGFEATIKELTKDQSGQYWLRPRSSDPRFTESWPLPVTDDNEDVKILGVVVAYTRPIDPPPVSR